jgi:hypothetical protein
MVRKDRRIPPRLTAQKAAEVRRAGPEKAVWMKDQVTAMSDGIINNRYNLTDALIRQTEKINSTQGPKPEGISQTYNGKSFRRS